MTNSRQHAENRERKAHRLAAVILDCPSAANAVESIPADTRRLVEQISGERTPASEATWTRVSEIVQRSLSRRAEWALRIIDNEAWLPPVVAA